MMQIQVTAQVERSRKGRRVRVRAVCDGRAVQCCAAWRMTIVGRVVTINAHDDGKHWRRIP